MQKDNKVIFFGSMTYWYKSFSFCCRIEDREWSLSGIIFIEILVHLLAASLLAEEKVEGK
jgi:hypothetical protein